MAQKDDMNNWRGKEMRNTLIGRIGQLVAKTVFGVNTIALFLKLFPLSMF